MEKFEYLAYNLVTNNGQFDIAWMHNFMDVLAENGENGWELVTSTPINPSLTMFVFKRKMQ